MIRDDDARPTGWLIAGMALHLLAIAMTEYPRPGEGRFWAVAGVGLWLLVMRRVRWAWTALAITAAIGTAVLLLASAGPGAAAGVPARALVQAGELGVVLSVPVRSWAHARSTRSARPAGSKPRTA